MANWDFIFPYNLAYQQWLIEQELPCPAVNMNNREPTTADLLWAIAQFPSLTYLIRLPYLEVAVRDTPDQWVLIQGFNWHEPTALPQFFALRGSTPWELALLLKLCERCGQLVLLPDSGLPSIVLAASDNQAFILDIWLQAQQHGEGWQYVYQRLYA